MTIKAPDKLTDDPWFPLPEVLRARYEAERRYDIRFNHVTGDKLAPPKERADIHQWVYGEATKNRSTTLDLDFPGGSESRL